MAIEISGSTAFVTGAGSGIGVGIAEALLREKARVIAADIDEEGLARTQRTLGALGEIHTMVLDVTDRTALADTAAEMKSRFGGIDILCNNAGIGPLSPMFGEGYRFWDRVLDVNLGGVVNGIVSFVPDMVARGRGHIVNTASFGGMLPAGGMFGIYTTSKFGIVGLSAALRETLAASGIGVSALCPGLTATGIASNARRTGHSPMAEELGIAEDAEKILEKGLAPIECGRMVVEGIRANSPYIFTHGEYRDQLAAHFETILSCFPAVATATGSPEEPLPFFHGTPS